MRLYNQWVSIASISRSDPDSQIWERVTTRGLLFEASKDAQLPRTLRQGCEERAERPKEL
jgi:hypothetical protein